MMCCGPPLLAVPRAIVYSSCCVCVFKSLFIFYLLWESHRPQAAGGQLQLGPCSADAGELSPALCHCPCVSKPAGLRQAVETPPPGISVCPLLSHQAAGEAEKRDRPCDGLWLLCQSILCQGIRAAAPSPRGALTEGPGLAAHSRLSRVDSAEYGRCRP